MSDHFIGIDFGTSNSSVAWYDPRSGQADVILNAEGEAKTPSLVYFGGGETLIGKPVDELIEDAAADQEQRGDIFQRTQISIKRRLVNPKRIFLPGGRIVTPVEVAAEILKKLKHDVEEGHFHEEVRRAVITCPAEYDSVKRGVIKQAGLVAGFDEVELLEEPVAGALAYARAGLNVGSHVLVYDLGGGTFDLAVLNNEDDETFRVAMQPKGMERCGGDDFDLALYRYCDKIVQRELGRPILPASGDIDLKFLRLCRRRKENLSWREKGEFSSLLSSNNGATRFRHDIDRGTFERLIDEYIADTVRLTEEIIEQANAEGHELDSVVLIGGSSRVPLVLKRLDETLPVDPLGFDKKDVAVALGAAHYANILWGRKIKPATGLPSNPGVEQYKQEIESALRDGRLNKAKSDQLGAFASRLGLNAGEAAQVELRILGSSREDILLQQYRRAVEMACKDEKLGSLEVEWLGAVASEMGLDEVRAVTCEREAVGATKEEIYRRTREKPQPSPETVGFSPMHTLTGHSNAVNAIAFSPDGRFLVSGGADGAVGGWDAHVGRSVGTLAGHSGRVNSVAFDPEGRAVASGGSDKKIRVWGLPNGEPLHALDHTDWVFSVAISHVNRFLASGGADAEIKLWDLQTGKLLRNLTGHSYWVLSVAIGPDGRTLVSGSADGTVRVWNLETSEQSHVFEHPDLVHCVALGPDAVFVATGCEDGMVRVFNIQTGELTRTLLGHSAPILSVTISSDRRQIISGGADGKIKVWSFETGEPLDILSGHSAAVGSVAMSPNGQLLASGGHDREIRIWRKAGTEGRNDRTTVVGSGPPDLPRPTHDRPPKLPDPSRGRPPPPPPPPPPPRRPPGLPN